MDRMTKKYDCQIATQSGFYRFWLEIDNFEWSYIGIAKNIANRMKYHLSKIKSFYQLSGFHKDFIGFLAKQTVNKGGFAMPISDARYYKITLMCYLYDKKPEDFKCEVLKFTNIDLIADQEEETKFIEKYHSEKCGFNGPFAKKFQIKNYLSRPPFNISLEQKKILKYLLRLQNMKNMELEKELEQLKEADYRKYPFWLGFQMGIMMKNDELKKKFANHYFDNLNLVQEKIRKAYKLRKNPKIRLNKIRKWTFDMKCSRCLKSISKEIYGELRFVNAYYSGKEHFLCKKCCMKISILKKILDIQFSITK